MKIKFLKEFRLIRNDRNDGTDRTAPAGHVVDLDNEESAHWLIDNGFAEEVKETRWWPAIGEEYYFIDDFVDVSPCIWEDDSVDKERYAMGNVFKTKKAANRYRGYLEAMTYVQQDEGVLTPEQLKKKESEGDEIYYVGFDHAGNCLVGRLDLFEDEIIPNAIFFEEATRAQASLDKHPNEWKVIANYDWSRE